MLGWNVFMGIFWTFIDLESSLWIQICFMADFLSGSQKTLVDCAYSVPVLRQQLSLNITRPGNRMPFNPSEVDMNAVWMENNRIIAAQNRTKEWTSPCLDVRVGKQNNELCGSGVDFVALNMSSSRRQLAWNGEPFRTRIHGSSCSYFFNFTVVLSFPQCSRTVSTTTLFNTFEPREGCVFQAFHATVSSHM